MTRPFFCFATLSLVFICTLAGADSHTKPQNTKENAAIGLSLVKQQHYDNAIDKLEQILDQKPNDPEALTYLATANLYKDRDFTKSEQNFSQAFKAGGGATFWVSHSHEKFANSEMADYCRGWLHLRKNHVEFVPENSDHTLNLNPGEITEFKQNRLSKTLFHLEYQKKTFNFRPRTGDEGEVLLILILYRKFVQQ